MYFLCSVSQDVAYVNTWPAYQRMVIRKMVCMYFVLSKRALAKSFKEASVSRFMAPDVVTFDASRVSCKEVLAIEILSDNLLVIPPIAILLDAHAATDPAGSLQNVAKALQGKQQRKKKPPKRPAGTATKLLCHAVFWSLLQVCPFRNTEIWSAGTTDNHRQHLRLFDDDKGQYYNFDPDSHRSHWVLHESLWSSVGNRCLVFIRDEGSTGFSL